MTTPVPVEGGETGTADEGYVQRAIDLDLGGTQFYLKSEVSGLVVLGHLDERIALLVLVKTVGLRRVAHRVSVEDARNVDLNRLSVHGVRMLSDADAEGVNGLHDELEGVTTALLRGIPLQSVLRSMEGFEAALQPTGGGALPRVINIVAGELSTQFRSVRDVAAHLRWASAAHVYAGLVEQGHRSPSKRTAELLKISTNEARNRISRARSRGYLSPVAHGRSGGTMTAEGLALLETLGAIAKSGEN